MEKKSPKPNFQLHIDTQLLIERIPEKAREIGGEVITYREISEWIGRDVQTEASGILRSALRYLAREEAVFFSVVRGQGIKLITAAEKNRETPIRGRKQIRRAAARIQKELQYVPPEALTRDEQKERNANIAFAGTLQAWTREKEAKKVIESAPDDGKLSVGKVIDILSRKAG